MERAGGRQVLQGSAQLQFGLMHDFLGRALQERGKLASSIIDLSHETMIPIIDRLASVREELSNQR